MPSLTQRQLSDTLVNRIVDIANTCPDRMMMFLERGDNTPSPYVNYDRYKRYVVMSNFYNGSCVVRIEVDNNYNVVGEWEYYVWYSGIITPSKLYWMDEKKTIVGTTDFEGCIHSVLFRKDDVITHPSNWTEYHGEVTDRDILKAWRQFVSERPYGYFNL